MSSPKKIRWSVPFINASMWLLVVAIGASAQNSPSVTRPSAFAVSPRVIDLPDDDEKHSATERPYHRLPDRDSGENRDDDARQRNPEPRVKAFPRPSFNGISANGFAPPDTNIAVGPSR